MDVRPSRPPADDWAVLDPQGIDRLIGALGRRGYRTLGPVVRDGAITLAEIAGVADLPAGWRDAQDPGRYRLERTESPAFFAWAVGPHSAKAQVLPPRDRVWRASAGAGGVEIAEAGVDAPPTALVGIRPCDVAGLGVLDRVLGAAGAADPAYLRRRAQTFVVVAECGSPAATCFCTSMGTGPDARSGFDLALTELVDGGGHRFLSRSATGAGAALLRAVGGASATTIDRRSRDGVLGDAAARIRRRLDRDGLPALLERNLEHPRWDEVADRCLACGNCTMVCPTCFCTSVEDTTDLTGASQRERRWASCYEVGHSYIHGGPVRPSTRARYRQWLTHKLGTWHDQFGESGCVGCGRCVTWCPVGIDLCEEVDAIRRADGATAARPAPGGS